jgi:UPF0755 protein
MARRGRKKPSNVRRIIAALALVAVLLGAWFVHGWTGAGPLKANYAFTVPPRSTLGSIAAKLQKEGAIASATRFRLRARLFADGGATLKAGQFTLPKGASPSRILAIIESDDFLTRLVSVPEGMPSIMVWDRLNAQPLLSGKIAVPPEGSILPDSYAFQTGEGRQAVVDRMQAAMHRTLGELWPSRSKTTPVKTPQQAVILASIVEKETAKPSERPMVAGLYANRLRLGMRLQADPTIIYPITKGKPLGRRIRESEVHAVNTYNTYAITGLPAGPITNPSRASIAAVLNPAKTDAIYMVADGTGGHVFASTLEQHNKNVAKWFAIRKARDEL